MVFVKLIFFFPTSLASTLSISSYSYMYMSLLNEILSHAAVLDVSRQTSCWPTALGEEGFGQFHMPSGY
jgi:hypothetical protein